MITICCCPAHGEASNEEPNGESGTRQCAAVLQSRADADGGSQLRFLGGTSREGEPQPHPIPGSAAGDRVRRAGPARHHQPDSRCATTTDESFGGIRFHASAALDAGADEICFVVGEQNIDEVLETLPRSGVHFEAGERAAEVLEALARRPVASGSVDYEPLADLDRAAMLIRAARTPQFRPVTIRAHRFSEAGFTTVQELGFALAEGVEIVSQLTDRGLTPDEAAQALAFSFAIGSNYFLEIAKLRAARTVWARAVASFQPAHADAAKMTIYARTSHWTKTIYDPHLNLLRSTTEAMAAAVGGADSLQVEAFDEPYRAPDESASRLARNTQLILKQEAWLDRSVDPAGGSYYLEVLTDSLAREAWKLFQQIEAAGGFLKYSESGALERDIAKSRADREADVATRRTAIVGTNQNPNLAERMLPKIQRQDAAPRAARIFEAIRLRTERHAARTGHTPRFLLLETGDLKMRKARSGFITNFFGCAGLEIVM